MWPLAGSANVYRYELLTKYSIRLKLRNLSPKKYSQFMIERDWRSLELIQLCHSKKRGQNPNRSDMREIACEKYFSGCGMM